MSREGEAIESPVWLEVISGEGEVERSVAVDRAPFTIGREASGLACPDDEQMALRHARLDRAGEVLRIQDSGEGSGVWLRVRGAEGRRLEQEDQLWLGMQILVARLEAGAWQLRHHGPSGRLVAAHPVPPEGLFIGRTSDLILDPEDTRLSRRHAQIVHEEGGLRFYDRGAHNGSYVRLRKPTPLEIGDEFRLATHRFRLVDSPVSSESSAPPAAGAASDLPVDPLDRSASEEPAAPGTPHTESPSDGTGVASRFRRLARQGGPERAPAQAPWAELADAVEAQSITREDEPASPREEEALPAAREEVAPPAPQEEETPPAPREEETPPEGQQPTPSANQERAAGPVGREARAVGGEERSPDRPEVAPDPQGCQASEDGSEPPLAIGTGVSTELASGETTEIPSIPSTGETTERPTTGAGGETTEIPTGFSERVDEPRGEIATGETTDVPVPMISSEEPPPGAATSDEGAAFDRDATIVGEGSPDSPTPIVGEEIPDSPTAIVGEEIPDSPTAIVGEESIDPQGPSTDVESVDAHVGVAQEEGAFDPDATILEEGAARAKGTPADLLDTIREPRPGSSVDEPPGRDEPVVEPQALLVIDGESESVSLEVAPGTTILEAVLAAGVERGRLIDWECGDGGCGVCVVGVVEGADGLDPPDPASGEMKTIQITEQVAPDPNRYRLACVARVRGTVRVRRL